MLCMHQEHERNAKWDVTSKQIKRAVKWIIKMTNVQIRNDKRFIGILPRRKQQNARISTI